MGLLTQDSLDSQTSTSSSRTSSSSWPISRGPHRCLAILHGQKQADLHVTALALSGNYLYAGSNEGEIRGWGHLNLQEAPRFGCGEGAVKCLVVVGSKVISAHQDHKIRVWRRSKSNPQEHRLVNTLPSVKDYISNFLPSKNCVQVRRHHQALWINHHDSITSLALGNGVLYSASWDKSVKVWRLADFKCLESLNEHIDAVNALAVDKPNNLLYTGSGDATIKVFQNLSQETTNTTTNQNQLQSCQHALLATLEAKSPVNALALSPDGAFLYSGQSDKTVTVWKRKEVDGSFQWAAVGALRGHRFSILCVSAVLNLVVSGSADKTVRVWRRDEAGAHHCVAVMAGHAGPVKSLCVAPDTGTGVLVYSGGMDGDVRVWWVPSEDDDSEADHEGVSSSDDGADPGSPVVVNWRSSSDQS